MIESRTPSASSTAATGLPAADPGDLVGPVTKIGRYAAAAGPADPKDGHPAAVRPVRLDPLCGAADAEPPEHELPAVVHGDDLAAIGDVDRATADAEAVAGSQNTPRAVGQVDLALLVETAEPPVKNCGFVRSGRIRAAGKLLVLALWHSIRPQ